MSDNDSRTEIIIHELECGGFTRYELQEIIDLCEKELEKLNEFKD